MNDDNLKALEPLLNIPITFDPTRVNGSIGLIAKLANGVKDVKANPGDQYTTCLNLTRIEMLALDEWVKDGAKAQLTLIEQSKTGKEAIPMRLPCPDCGKLHIDEGEFMFKQHHTHACQFCGMVWRPALVPTVGVQFLPGFKNDKL